MKGVTKFEIVALLLFLWGSLAIAMFRKWQDSKLKCHHCDAPLDAAKRDFCSPACEDEFVDSSFV